MLSMFLKGLRPKRAWVAYRKFSRHYPINEKAIPALDRETVYAGRV